MTRSTDHKSLRERAEERLEEMPRTIRDATPAEVKALLHDLQVHQIELEIQNEELRNVQGKLERSRDGYAQLFDEAPVGYLIVDGHGRIRQANATFATLCGRPLSSLQQRPFVVLLVDSDQRIFLSRFNALFKQPAGKRMTLRIKREQGGCFWARLEARPSRLLTYAHDTEETRDQLLMIVSDVTDEIEAREQLTEVGRWLEIENRLQALFLDHDEDDLYAEVLGVAKDALDSPIGYFGYIDSRGNLVCPSMSREVFNACQVPDKKIVFPASSWGGLWGRSLKERRTLMSNQGLEPPDGHLSLTCALAVPLMRDDALIGQIVVANRDGGYQDSERQLLERMAAFIAPILYQRRRAAEAEDQLRQAQKMESVGRLAGGVAHDFNNLLTGIIGNLELAELGLEPEHESRAFIAEAQGCADRAADLVQRLLTFSRKQLVRHSTFDLNQVVNSLTQLLERVISEDILLSVQLHDQPTWVRMDRGQVEQILVNLVINSRDAMPGGGRLTISLGQTRLDPDVHARRADLEPGEYVDLTVADTGHGMSPEVSEHIFEPFFTTKEPSVGTGLGLSMVYGSVMQSGGHIEVDTTPGKGTTVRVLLPLAKAPQDAATLARSDSSLSSGTGVVLVVEDEPALRDLCSKVLVRAGYEVLTACDGIDALAVVDAHRGPLHLVITDVIMPRMNGGELVRHLHEQRPNLEVLFTSGYSENVITQHGVLEEGVNFLRKPYRPAVLAAKVGELFGARGIEPVPPESGQI